MSTLKASYYCVFCLHIVSLLEDDVWNHASANPISSIGFRLQNEEYNPRDQQVIELPDAREKARLAKDPVYRMQREQERSYSVKEASEHVASLLETQKAKGADGADHYWNRQLKREMRSRRREAKALDER